MSVKTAFFYTLGCRLNQSESSLMANQLERFGYSSTKDSQTADVCVLNTCTVTGQSDAKCRQMIRSLRRSNPKALLAVTGCFSQMASEEILEIGGVDLIIGNQSKLRLGDYLERAEQSEEPIVILDRIYNQPFSIEMPRQTHQRTRSNLKIQDGCDFICSFCIIPFARGRARCRNFENILNEAQTLAEQGTQEVILTGVNIGLYQEGNKNFYDLLDALGKVSEIRRIRISSIEPTTVDERIFEYMTRPEGKVVPYLHLPLQSASDVILQAMRRKYNLSYYQDFIAEAKASVPNICIGSDILTGFPGETDDLFNESYSNLKKMPLHYFHVFPYSERKGTRSANMPGKVPQEVILRRARVLRELSLLKRYDYSRSFLNSELSVLFEEKDAQGQWLGYSENYIRVSTKHPENLKNRIHLTRITSVESGRVIGELSI